MHQRGTGPRWLVAAFALLLSGAAFACVLSDALTGPEAPSIVLRYTGDTVVVVGDTIPISLSADIAGSAVADARFRYVIADSTVLCSTADRSALIARRRGRTVLTVILQSPLSSPPPTLAVTLDVVVASIAVSPASDTLTSIGDTLALAAPAYDAQGDVIAGVNPSWRSSDTAVATFVAPGRLVARGNGQVVVQAVVDNDTGTASVVIAQRLADVQITPSTIELSALTAESSATAVGLDARGHPLAGTTVSWTSEAPTIVTVTSAGRIRAIDNGTTRLHAQSGSIQGTATIVVEQRAKQIAILPDPVPAVEALGDQITLTATAADSLGFVVVVPNKSVGWATLDPAIAIVDRTGLVAGVGVGTGRIIAVMDAARDTVAVPVGDLPASVELLPSIATLASVKDTLLLSASVRNSRGNLIQNPAVSWRSSDSTIVRVDSTPRPLGVAIRKGTARVIATAGSLSDTSFVTVTNAPAFINISGSADTLTSIWDSLPVPIVVLNSRGDTLSSTSVQWSSDAPLVGSVTGSGLVVARDTGLAIVQAKYGVAPGDTLRDSIAIRVFNLPASLVLNGDLDTMTAVGQSLTYAAEVRNARGNPIPGYPVAWSSTNASVVSASSAGLVTSTGLGSAVVIAQASGVADSLVGVVVNPTRLVVNNAIQIAPRFGTAKRPYARIQDGVNAAEIDDTVFVRRGAAPYSETVALTRRATVLGDDSAFLASVPRDPLLLPLISHDTGAAGITAYTAATIVLKNLVLRHTVGGPAIDARQADLRVARFYVNPPGTVTGRIGRGIALDSASGSSATITTSEIHSARGYGIRLRDATGVTIDSVYVESVDSVAGAEAGAGIRILRGSSNVVRRATIRGTQGPAILVDSTAGVTIASNDLAGRQRLVLVRASNGATVQSNLFDTRPLGLNGEVFSGGTQFEWAAVELDSSWQAAISTNTFRDVTQVNQEPFNAMRFVYVRNPSSPSQVAAQVTSNRVVGARAGVRSQDSNLNIQASRFDSTLVGVVGTGGDTWTLQNDTIATTLQDACVRATSGNSITVTASVLQRCTSATPYAIAVGGGTLRVQQSTFLANRAAVTFAGTSFTGSGNSVSGLGFTPAPGDTLTALAALQVNAPFITVLQNSVANHLFNAGVRLEGGASTARLDSNFVSANNRGVLLGSLANFNARDNDIFDNMPAGVVNEDTPSRSLPQTWWGDARGPRGLADPAATGDSLIGDVNASSWNATPHAGGATATQVRIVRGNGQSAPRGTPLPQTFAVRVIDATGRPVAGIDVTFRVTVGGGTFGGGGGPFRVTTNASGLAEATLTLGPSAGTNTATATGAGTNTLTFTATGL